MIRFNTIEYKKSINNLLHDLKVYVLHFAASVLQKLVHIHTRILNSCGGYI